MRDNELLLMRGLLLGSAVGREVGLTDEKLLALSSNELSVFIDKEKLVVDLADAGGGPSRSPRVSKGFVAAREPSLTSLCQNCRRSDLNKPLLTGKSSAEPRVGVIKVNLYHEYFSAG